MATLSVGAYLCFELPKKVHRQGQKSIIQPPHLAITSVVGWDAAVGVAAELGGLAAHVEATLRSDGDGECNVLPMTKRKI
jgi:hypothetical protein